MLYSHFSKVYMKFVFPGDFSDQSGVRIIHICKFFTNDTKNSNKHTCSLTIVFLIYMYFQFLNHCFGTYPITISSEGRLQLNNTLGTNEVNF